MNTTPDPYRNNASNYPYQNPYGSNPSDPTMAYLNYQHPYHQPAPPPQSPPSPHQRLFRWYGHVWKSHKFATGCLSLIAVLFVCSICSIAAGASGSKGTQTIDANQATPTQIVQANTPTPTPKPTIKPTHAPTPTPAPTTAPIQLNQPTQAPYQPPPPPPPPPACSGAEIAGGCYNTDPNGGALVYSPPSTFCNYFTCVSTFWTANSGYVAECSDGHYTHSGGVSGACSRNGGVLTPVYRH